MAKPRINMRALQRRWDGYKVHPLLEELDQFLSDKGYRRLGFEAGTYGCGWERELFAQYREQIRVDPTGPWAASGAFGFSVGLYVVSRRPIQVRKALQLLDCWTKFNRYIESGTPEVETAVLSNHMGWMRLKWEPRVQIPAPSGINWFNLPTSRSSEAVAEVVACWEHQYQDYLRMIDTPLKLARVISDTSAVPGNERRDGPMSADPAVFAAILLHDNGCGEEALAVLEAERIYLAAGGKRVQLTLDVFLCLQEKLANWITGEISIPKSDES